MGEFETKLKREKKNYKKQSCNNETRIPWREYDKEEEEEEKKHCLRQLMYFRFIKDQLVIMAEPFGVVPLKDIR